MPKIYTITIPDDTDTSPLMRAIGEMAISSGSTVECPDQHRIGAQRINLLQRPKQRAVVARLADYRVGHWAPNPHAPHPGAAA